MFRSIGFAELMVVLVLFCLLLVPTVFYILALQRVLERCSIESRTMPPGTVWLLFIPVFNIVWQFIIVINIAKSLHNEFTKRNLTGVEREPGKSIGLAMSILSVASAIPMVGIAAGTVGFVCWIVYWVKIAGYSRLQPPLLTATS